MVKNMALSRNETQPDKQSATPGNVTPLISGSREGGVAKAASSIRSLIVPGAAIVIALTAIVAAGANWDSWVANQSVQSTDDAAVFADVSAISSRVGGTIEGISVRDYARVKAGDMLFSIDRAPYEVALRSSRAKLEAARAQLQDNDSQRAFQLAQVDVAVAQQQASAADEVETGKELERQIKLASDGRASSVQTLERATAARDRALANAKMNVATVNAQRAQLDVLARQREALKAGVDFAAADVAANELELSYTEIRAPLDGVVAKRDVQLGTYVTAGTSLISIVPLPQVYVLANYKENQLARVQEGQHVDISVDMLPGEKLHGTVSKISPASGSTFALLPADNASGNFTKVAQRLTVRIEFDPDQANSDRLRPGMSVVTRIATREGENHGL
jgi:membrane fusion protein (multidrug efflux system)